MQGFCDENTALVKHQAAMNNNQAMTAYRRIVKDWETNENSKECWIEVRYVTWF